MNRPSKKEIRAAVEKLKEKKEATSEIDYTAPKPQEKGFNNRRIRKKGV